MVTTVYRRDHATLAALCRFPSNDAESIFSDKTGSTLSRLSIDLCVNDATELCRFGRDRVLAGFVERQGNAESKLEFTSRSNSNGGSAGASPSQDVAFLSFCHRMTLKRFLVTE
jgi:hypothetical protein